MNSGEDIGISIIAFIAALLCLLLSALLQNTDAERWSFASAITMVLLIEVALWFSIVKNDLRAYSLKALFVYGMLSRFFIIGMCFTIPIGSDYLFPWSEYLFSEPLIAALGALVAPISIVSVYLLSRLFDERKKTDIPILDMIRHSGKRFEAFLIFAGCVKLLYWLSTTALDNPLFYIIRIFNSTTFFIPFFVGLGAYHFRKALYFWLFIMLFELIVAFYTGSRGAAFRPILIFSLGFIIGIPTWRLRIMWGLGLVPVGLLLLALAAFIGSVRDVVGRVDLATALKEGSMVEAIQDDVLRSEMVIRENIFYATLRRLTVWPTYVVPTMTPEPVPYRGFDDFGRELRGIFHVGIFGLIDPISFRGGYYFGTEYLRQYGFAVHFDEYGRNTSNVPNPIHVDAYARGGWIAAFGFYIFAAALLFIAERLLRKYLLPAKTPFFLMMLAVLCYISVRRSDLGGVVNLLRHLLLEGAFCLVIFYTFDRMLRPFVRRQ